MLAILIQRYDKNIISFQEQETNWTDYRPSEAAFYDCIDIIYLLIKSFFDSKMSIFEEYGAFKS